ncbi:MAG: hypothetical protein C0623_00380 [Desulfuromonas sp.]|nr:MAG: hypothetical protein C0623_00380 [Desulfuromonas sp.]
MDDTGLFVVTVASEKGGVGKTTIATNLAVYLKALCEDLPVTVISFDNHFSVDNMFAIGEHRGYSVAGIFSGKPLDEMVQLGEYGVQFMVSERQLNPPDDDISHLSKVLARGDLSGILVIDTRPILDYFTHSALLAADLVLVPVKDRPSLVNASALRQAMLDAGSDPESLWLVPSLIDGRTRLKERTVGMRDFLVYSAEERDFQVVDTYMSKSPKVESLTTSFSSRIYPVLTHARGTSVHKQFKDLAAFVGKQYNVENRLSGKPPARVLAAVDEMPPGRASHLTGECPNCGRRVTGQDGYFFQDLRHHQTGFFHSSCVDLLLANSELQALFPERGGLLFHLPDTGLTGEGGDVTLALYDEDGEEVVTELVPQAAAEKIIKMMNAATDRDDSEMFREMILVAIDPDPPIHFLEDEGAGRFAQLRRHVMTDLRAKDQF